MSDINALIRRIDQEVAAEGGRQKAAWAEWVQWSRGYELRLQRYEFEKTARGALRARRRRFIECSPETLTFDTLVRSDQGVHP